MMAMAATNIAPPTPAITPVAHVGHLDPLLGALPYDPATDAAPIEPLPAAPPMVVTAVTVVWDAAARSGICVWPSAGVSWIRVCRTHRRWGTAQRPRIG